MVVEGEGGYADAATGDRVEIMQSWVTGYLCKLNKVMITYIEVFHYLGCFQLIFH